MPSARPNSEEKLALQTDINAVMNAKPGEYSDSTAAALERPSASYDALNLTDAASVSAQQLFGNSRVLNVIYLWIIMEMFLNRRVRHAL